jgi:hypothetical protein
MRAIKPTANWLLPTVWLAVTVCGRAAESPTPAQLAFFEAKVRPVLVEHCYKCHSLSAEKLKGGLALDSRESLLKGGDLGPVLKPGDPDASLLIKAIGYRDQDLQMPPKGKLSPAAIADLTEWVRMGAPDPRSATAVSQAKVPAASPYSQEVIQKQAVTYWSLQPIQNPVPPSVRDRAWARNPIDQFILARLEAKKLKPAAPADKRTLIRRATFDLIGLPPTPAEVDDFLADASPDAFARVVDRLLASPRYGERWGRHWLDLARYADTNGQDENLAMANAFRYRDYVIAAFNADKPYDQFVREQLAGDLLPDTGNPALTHERWAATGFLVLGPKMLAEQDKPKLMMDVVDEQIEVVSRAFLGLTVACARCHDHKFDPVSARDYYALAGIFRSTKTMGNLEFVSKWNERSLGSKEDMDRFKAHPIAVKDKQQELNRETKKATDELALEWNRQLAPALLALRELPATTNAPETKTLEALATKHQLNPAFLTHCARLVDRARQAPESFLGPWAWAAAVPPEAFASRADELARRLAASSLTNGALADFQPAPASTAELAERYQSLVLQLETEFKTSALTSDNLPATVKLGPGRLRGGLLATSKSFYETPHANKFEPPQLTVEAWVRMDEYPAARDTRRWIVSKSANEETDGHYALIVQGKEAGAYLNIGGGPANLHAVLSGDRKLKLREWNHLLFTFNGVDLKLFLNGERVASQAINLPRSKGAGPLMIGRRPDGYINFDGGIDEVHIYRRGLTEAEIKERFTKPENAPPNGGVFAVDFDPSSPEKERAFARMNLRSLLHQPDGLFAIPTNSRPYFAAPAAANLARLEKELGALTNNVPPEPPMTLAVEENPPVNLPVHIRGSHLNLAKDPVPRGFIQVLNRPGAPAVPEKQSGRLQLADWLLQPDHPLTARVAVNRLWQEHFGDGLVRTPDNFGLRGEAPSHPELLDWLAREFVRQGWSIKQMHRLMLLSNTYQTSTTASSKAVQLDPENRLLSHTHRRRLDAEPIRDSLLFLGGALDLTMSGRATESKNAAYSRTTEGAEQSRRRSVYLKVVRSGLYDVFTIFDFADPTVGSGKRSTTVVSHQALFFMNSPLVLDQAKNLANLLLEQTALDDIGRLQQAYQRAYSRPATSKEIARDLYYLQRFQDQAGSGTARTAEARLAAWQGFCQALLSANEFIYLN